MENGFRADLSWLEDPQVFQVGRLDAHSDHCWFDSLFSNSWYIIQKRLK